MTEVAVDAPRVRAWPSLHGRTLTVAVGVAAALPVIASTIRGVAERWTPFGDQAVVATRAFDVLSSHSPLVGQYSDASTAVHRVVHALGPLLFWLLALPARLGPPSAIAVVIGIANVAAAIGCVAIARRLGGLPLMLLAAVALALMARSLVSETWHDPWPPSAALMPLALLTFLCAALGAGDHRLLPLAVLVWSFVAQAHLPLLFPVLALALVALTGARGLTRRAALSALGVGVVCWALPLADELAGRAGNATSVLRAATAAKSTVGLTAGWHALVRATGVVPWWLRVPGGAFDRKAEISSAPGTFAAVTCLLLLCALVAVAVVGLRRGRRALAVAALTGMLLSAALVLMVALTPSTSVGESSLGYTTWWASIAGMWVWLVLAWALVIFVRSPRLAAFAPLAGVGAALAVGALAATAGRADEHAPLYRPTRTLEREMTGAIPSGRTVWLDGSPGFTTHPLKPAAVYALRRHGSRPLGIGSTSRLGSWYELDHRRYDSALYIHDGAQPGGAVVARASVQGRAIAVTLSR